MAIRHREHSALSKVLLSLKEAGLYSGRKTTLFTIFHNLGFNYCDVSGRKVLTERENVVVWRCQYLLTINHKDVRIIVWYIKRDIGESGHTVRKAGLTAL